MASNDDKWVPPDPETPYKAMGYVGKQETYDPYAPNVGLGERRTVETLPLREFESGATRDTDTGKLDYEGFLSPAVLECYAQYMHKHRVQTDGSLRASDNWQKGMPFEVYMKSLWRHFKDVWSEHRGLGSQDGLKDALCGVLFNTMGYLHETLKKEREDG